MFNNTDRKHVIIKCKLLLVHITRLLLISELMGNAIYIDYWLKRFRLFPDIFFTLQNSYVLLFFVHSVTLHYQITDLTAYYTDHVFFKFHCKLFEGLQLRRDDPQINELINCINIKGEKSLCWKAKAILMQSSTSCWSHLEQCFPLIEADTGFDSYIPNKWLKWIIWQYN